MTHEEVLSYITKHGHEIGAAAVRGHTPSQQVVSLYTMYQRRTEQATLGLLSGAIHELERDRIVSEEAAERGG